MDAHRAMKEAFWGLVGSVQKPVENPIDQPAQYSARIATKDGPKIARLKLTFEDIE